MKQIKSAARVARQVRETETAMDKTILQTNALVVAIIEARIEGNFAAEVGHDALGNAVSGLGALIEARGAIVRSHTNLAKVAQDHAIKWRMDGPMEEKLKPFLSADPSAQDAA